MCLPPQGNWKSGRWRHTKQSLDFEEDYNRNGYSIDKSKKLNQWNKEGKSLIENTEKEFN